MTERDVHARAKALFLEAIEQPAESRKDFVHKACADDPELLREVETLLEYTGADAGATISIGAVDEPSERFHAGDMFAGRYRIVAPLGRGAMGEVFRAEDTTLGVEVALKLLLHPSPGLVDRLRQEVRLSRRVTHPGVCRVYDVGEADGEHFFTMEYVDGENLSSLLSRIGRLPVDKVRDIGVQIAEGLAAAHEHGVIHRDLKPSNIMLDAAGSVRITDFGVATSPESRRGEFAAGTPAYMAPELLADGGRADVRSDLYAVGLILYEALTGRVPQTRERRDETFEKPATVLPFIDPRLEEIILSLLHAEPDKRPVSAEAVAESLRALATETLVAGAGRRSPRQIVAIAGVVAAVAAVFFFVGDRVGTRNTERSIREEMHDLFPDVGPRGGKGIAVMPVEDTSEEESMSHLAESVQDVIIDHLSGVDSLRVISEESVDGYHAAGGDTESAGRELGVDYVVIGRVNKSGDRVRMNMELIETGGGRRVWEDHYEAEYTPGEIHQVERKISSKILDMLRSEAEAAVPDATSEPPPTDNPRAYELYLKGHEHSPPPSKASFDAAVDFLEQAVAEDDRLADAYAALGTAYVVAAARGWTEPAAGYAKAKANAERALQLDESLAEAQVVLALVRGDYEWNWSAAEAAYRRALALNPNSAWGYRSFARFLSSQGRFDESVQATRRALEINPTSAVMLQGGANRLYEARRYERAEAMARLAIRLDPNYSRSYAILGLIHLEQAKFNDAIREFQALVERTNRSDEALALLAYAYGRAGRSAQARTIAGEVADHQNLDGVARTALALAVGDEKGALDALASAVDARARPSIWLAVNPVFDPLRSHPDFAELVMRVGLPRPQDRVVTADH